MQTCSSSRKRYREKQREAAQVAATTLVLVAAIDAPRRLMNVVTALPAEADAPGQSIAGGTIEIQIGRAMIRVDGRSTPKRCVRCWGASDRDRPAGGHACADRGGHH